MYLTDLLTFIPDRLGDLDISEHNFEVIGTFNVYLVRQCKYREYLNYSKIL